MSKTTIELPEDLRDDLRDERLPHESNYADTIRRLLGEETTEFVTSAEAERIAERVFEREVRR
jgi:hypothetical protein